MQAMISGAFSIIKQSFALGCFPRVLVKHTSVNVAGQIYIPLINWMLCTLTLVVVLGFGLTDPAVTVAIGNAYGKCQHMCK